MQVEDVRTLRFGPSLETDLAIVGSGPAGLSLAREFVGTRTRVLVLESGGLEELPEATALNEAESTGAPRLADPRDSRNRVFGGSSHTWAGRCRTFDEIDFEHRSWVPYSGWPVKPPELEPYIEKAGQVLHLGPNVYDDGLWAQLGLETMRHANAGPLRSCFWQYSRAPDQSLEFLRFGSEFLKLDAPNIRVLTNATVTSIATDESGRKLRSLEVARDLSERVTVNAKIVALCAGAIENPRLLLASNKVCPSGIGNQNGVVGRFLMDHPRTQLGEFRGSAAKAVQSRFGLFQLKVNGSTHYYTSGLALSADVQREERLLNCAAYLSEHRAADDPWDALKRLYKRQSESVPRDVFTAASAPGLLMEGLYQRLVARRNVAHKLDKLSIDCLVEQAPDPESRLTLSDKRDRYGVPLPRLHWKISDQERGSAARLGSLLSSEMARLGLEPPLLAHWVASNKPDQAQFTDVAHPTGTTRMATDRNHSVVDINSQVHGVDGIYVAGSSVFPTAGHANPTLMIVAMTLRLADWLKRKHFQLFSVIAGSGAIMTERTETTARGSVLEVSRLVELLV